MDKKMWYIHTMGYYLAKKSFLFNGTVTQLPGESVCPLGTRAFRSITSNVLESKLYRQKFFN